MKPVKAQTCELNPGVLDLLGNQIAYPSRIWVDDALIAAIGNIAMKVALAVVIEALLL